MSPNMVSLWIIKVGKYFIKEFYIIEKSGALNEYNWRFVDKKTQVFECLEGVFETVFDWTGSMFDEYHAVFIAICEIVVESKFTHA